MTQIAQLKEVMKTESELVEAIYDTLREQQRAIIHYEMDDLNRAVQRQQELLSPLEALEKERIKLALLAMNIHNVEDERKARENFSIDRLLPHLSEEDASEVKSLGERLRKGTESIVQITRENRRLLEYSRMFVRENIRILTGDYSKQLIDQKI